MRSLVKELFGLLGVRKTHCSMGTRELALMTLILMCSCRICLAETQEQNFSLTHHSIDLTISPQNQSLVCRDLFWVQSHASNLGAIEVYVSHMDNVSFNYQGRSLNWEEDHLGGNVSRIQLQLPVSLDKGQSIEILFSAKKKPYFFPVTSPIAQGATGQVGPESSFSSHILYYPIDETNNATGEVRIKVPKEYLAVSVGYLAETQQEEEHTVYTWSTNISTPRDLPFGFAVAKYEIICETSGEGTPIQIYYFEGEKERAQERLQVAKDAVDFCEELFGVCPFEKVAIAHISPNTTIPAVWGVSLPTLILLSDVFFETEISDDYANDPVEKSMAGPLVIVDEISHQWNFYGIALPNELAEGLAQYTDTLFAERYGGERALKRHMAYYEDIYKKVINLFPDAPISSPEVYNTSAYGGIAFCKGAMVLNMLRYVTTDEIFFPALRELFTTRRGLENSYQDLQAVMEKHYGDSLDWFFEEWYNQTGYPTYQVTMQVIDEEDTSYGVEVCIDQLQEGYVFKMPLDVTIYCEGGSETFPRVMVDSCNFTLPLRVSSRPFSARIDLDENLLKDVRYPASQITVPAILLCLTLTILRKRQPS